MSEKSMDDMITEWHEGDSDMELHEYLGLTLEQYNRWVQIGEIE